MDRTWETGFESASFSHIDLLLNFAILNQVFELVVLICF